MPGYEYGITQPPYNWTTQLGIFNNYRQVITQIERGVDQLALDANADGEHEYSDKIYDILHDLAEAEVKIENLMDYIRKDVDNEQG